MTGALTLVMNCFKLKKTLFLFSIVLIHQFYSSRQIFAAAESPVSENIVYIGDSHSTIENSLFKHLIPCLENMTINGQKITHYLSYNACSATNPRGHWIKKSFTPPAVPTAAGKVTECMIHNSTDGRVDFHQVLHKGPIDGLPELLPKYKATTLIISHGENMEGTAPQVVAHIRSTLGSVYNCNIKNNSDFKSCIQEKQANGVGARRCIWISPAIRGEPEVKAYKQMLTQILHKELEGVCNLIDSSEYPKNLTPAQTYIPFKARMTNEEFAEEVYKGEDPHFGAKGYEKWGELLCNDLNAIFNQGKNEDSERQ